MHNFCTLFDSYYLVRALAMYQSLEVQGEKFVLYVVCFDDLAYKILIKCNFPKIIPIPLKEFESYELLSIKNTRTRGEYCWTCTPHVIRHVLDRFNLSEVTYLDADLFFYDKASVLLDEFHNSNASVLITPHRYTPRYDQSKTSGVYCVQFMTFKSDEYGLTVLQWWQDRCIEWCFNRFEDGKFGDQKYLDDWPQRFRGVHVLHHIGGGVAPWNICKYRLTNGNNQLCIDGAPVVFYHYHGFKQYADDIYDLGMYRLSSSAIKFFYHSYIKCIKDMEFKISNKSPNFSYFFLKKEEIPKKTLREKLGLLRRLRGEYNEYKFKFL